MRKAHVMLGCICGVIGLLATVAHAEQKGKLDAKAGFNKHCAVCHPDGGNIINKTKSIRKGDLQKAGIKNWQGIVAKMRKPGPGMTAFPKEMIADKDAKAIAEYILKTFK